MGDGPPEMRDDTLAITDASDVTSSCPDGFDDCDGDPSHTCETDLRTNPLHCGRCRAPCLGRCADGACQDVRGVSGGDRHTCAAMFDGSVRCWGANELGQLGDGTSIRRELPVPVLGVDGILEVAAGGVASCARGRQVFCWGANTRGQLGNGTFTDRTTAVPARDLGVTVAVAVGIDHACALVPEGRVWCWGGNQDGQLGTAMPVMQSPFPVDTILSDDATFRGISTGYYYSCGVLSNGTVRCWGRNSSGQLGDGTPSDRRLRPSPVLSVSDARAVAAGAYHACALRAGGGVLCWGHNESGGLGDGTLAARATPAPVSVVDDALTIAAGAYHTCAIRRGGRVSCWGLNDHGQLGDGSTVSSPTPVDVSGSFRAQTITLGARHTCAVGLDGRLACWGQNANGDLGDGTTTDRLSPTPVRW
jgi:alpha-tubulin suppressor-like RCC1 family protein